MSYSKKDFLLHASLDEETLDVWISEEWLLPDETPGFPVFSDADAARAKLIGELMNDLGVNHQGIGIILDLLDQMHSLRKAMKLR